MKEFAKVVYASVGISALVLLLITQELQFILWVAIASALYFNTD